MASAEKDVLPATLEKLPAEVLLEICKLLCDHCSLERPATDLSNPSGIRTRSPLALHALSRTSRRLRSIARPILYHDVGGTVPFFEWFSNIAREPELAESVKTLQLGQVGRWEPSQALHAIHVSRGLGLDIHNDQFVTSTLRYPTELSLAITQVYDEVTMALCLNVETISLTITDCNSGLEATTLSHFANRLKSLGDAAQLKKLQHLTLCSYADDTFSIRNTAIRVILSAAPALRKLVLVGTSWIRSHHVGTSFHYYDFVPALRNLTTLELINSKIEYAWDGPEQDWNGREYRAFAKVIEMAENLKRFRYISCIKHDGIEHIPPAYLLKALRPRCETLETIEISTDDMTGHGDSNPIYTDLMVDRSNLEHFHNLHTLRLDETSFCEHFDFDDLENPEEIDWDCLHHMLPHTVKHLTIGTDCDLRTALRDIFCLGPEAADGNFPALESLHVILQYGPDNETVRPAVRREAAIVLDSLEEAFEGSGVRVSIDPNPRLCSEHGSDMEWETEDGSDDEGDTSSGSGDE
ncbi:hypothetical protein CEP51_000081 [Fusarium floridanum]|uniref:F-box domain-containing protein n=1 Tax=Fusarium floridanum TaxID=1325733 RepID=A0A428SPX7_9HYPO|nr:hypothetical protein CEP51_000081 [Fusarium floridanum]